MPEREFGFCDRDFYGFRIFKSGLFLQEVPGKKWDDANRIQKEITAMKKIKMTLSKKVVLIYISCIFLPVLLLAVFLHIKIDTVFQERTRDNLQNSVEKATGNIEKTLEGAENIAVSASIDETLVEILQKDYGSYDEFYQS